MRSRSHLPGWILLIGVAGLAGCESAMPLPPIPYRESERAATDLAAKPKLREQIRTILVERFGPDVQHITVPRDSGLREGGIYLANRIKIGDKVEDVTEPDPAGGKPHQVAGGYALYRNNCLQCHGVFGGGDGPTSSALFPRPRDYRPGVFKFTSTNPVNAKPSRDDLRRTLLYGLHGTSMPGFEAILTASEIDQVIDYMTFLAIRGETERYLIDEAMAGDKDDPGVLEPDLVNEFVQKVTSSWTDAEGQVVRPKAPRVASTPESVRRGRDFFLGANTEGPKLECTGCHGATGQGNGPAFVDRDIFDDVVFRFYSLDEAIERRYVAERDNAARGGHEPARAYPADTRAVGEFLAAQPALLKVLRDEHKLLNDGSITDPQFEYLVKNDMPKVADAARALVPSLDDPGFREYLVAKYDLWTKGSLDFWNKPLRAANLRDGVYKGGRRPLDLYWRLAKGINGAKMPAHANVLEDAQIWDIVNFVLALPDQPDLLKEPVPKAAPAAAKTAAVAPGDRGRGTR